jgi:hypothetical protein
MRSFTFSVFVSSWIHACGFAAEPAALVTSGPLEGAAVCHSPDKKHYVGWFDTEESGLPAKTLRSVVVCSSDWMPLFSFVTLPGQRTQAAWNSTSTHCVISDQPDNGGATVWLVYKKPEEEWQSRKLDPLQPLWVAHKEALKDRDTPLFRPFIEKVEWLSDTQVRFLIWSNLNNPSLATSGKYHVTIDVSSATAEPVVSKIPAE